MPKPIEWTERQDATIKRMRAAGAFWDAIAEAVGVSRWCAIERGRIIGAALPELAQEIDDSREPLPAGHAATWGAIIAGTCLAGASYPHRVFA